jgi:hypothetical protein
MVLPTSSAGNEGVRHDLDQRRHASRSGGGIDGASCNGLPRATYVEGDCG